jgi:hypothetical protein
VCAYLTKYAINGHKSPVLDLAICRYSVTIPRLVAAKNDGCVMAVFSPAIADFLRREIPHLPTMLENVLADIDILRTTVLALCPLHGIAHHDAGLLCAEIVDASISIDDLFIATRTPIYGTDTTYGVMGAFRRPARESLLRDVPAAPALLENVLATLVPRCP